MIARKLLGSFISALAGILAGAVITAITANGASHFDLFLLALIVTACLVLPVWLLLLLPLYFLVPRTSILWRPTISTIVGAFIGSVLLVAYGPLIHPDWGGTLPLAAAVGGVTALFASLTTSWFHDDRSRAQRNA